MSRQHTFGYISMKLSGGWRHQRVDQKMALKLLSILSVNMQHIASKNLPNQVGNALKSIAPEAVVNRGTPELDVGHCSANLPLPSRLLVINRLVSGCEVVKFPKMTLGTSRHPNLFRA